MSTLTRVLTICAEETVPSKILGGRRVSQAWAPTLTSLAQLSKTALALWRAAGTPPPPHPAYTSRANAKKALRSALRQQAAQDRRSFYKDVTAANDRNSPVFFHLIRRARRLDGPTAATILSSDGYIISETQDVLELWAKHFESLGRHLVPTLDLI